ncbi:hypothetical protein D3C76_1468990 [compost metagenome]
MTPEQGDSGAGCLKVWMNQDRDNSARSSSELGIPGQNDKLRPEPAPFLRLGEISLSCHKPPVRPDRKREEIG